MASGEPVIRPERKLETFSRGPELVRAIREMCRLNESADWRLVDGEWLPPSSIINPRIEAIVTEYDLTVTEWHYWCLIAMEVAS